MFAIDLQIDSSWVDGIGAPSQSSQFRHNGVNDTLQQIWESLSPGGFNMIRFPISVDDPQSAVRLVNLCTWGKANNVTLIPILQSAATGRNDRTVLSDTLKAFVSAVVSLTRQQDSSLATYTQIGYYQLEGAANHPGHYPGMTQDAAQQVLLVASQAVRQSEMQALQGTSVQPTPILVAASFDFELLQQGAIAGTGLDPRAEQMAQDSLLRFLMPLAAAPGIDALNVEWFPRSISSGDVDRFPSLLRALKTSYPEKQLTLTTGFSNAFSPADQQMQFYTVAVSNLADFRVSDGANSTFVGVVFRQALNGGSADSSLPGGITDPAQWNWSDKARQLVAMWSQGTSSTEMSWWLNKVQDNMGLVALQPNASGTTTIIPLPARQAFQQISATIAQVSENVGQFITVPAASPIASSVSAQPGLAQQPGIPPYTVAPTQSAVPSLQQTLLSLLQQFTSQMSSQLMARLTNSNPQIPANNVPNPIPPYSTAVPVAPSPVNSNSTTNGVWIGPQDVTVDTPLPMVGQPISIMAQLRNQGPQDIYGLTVQLIDPANSTATNTLTQAGVTVPRSGSAPVRFSWMPLTSTNGQVQLSLQVLDANGVQITSAAVPAITVVNAPNNVFVADAALPAFNVEPNPVVSPPADTVAPVSTVSLAPPEVPPAMPNRLNTNSTPSDTSSNQTFPNPPRSQVLVTFFGIGDTNPAASVGQIPALSAQVANLSDAPMEAAQAQVFVDESPQQVQAVGPLLPKQTQSMIFPPIQAALGPHALKIVVTTADGATASAVTDAAVGAPAGPSETKVTDNTSTTSNTRSGNTSSGNDNPSTAGDTASAGKTPATEPISPNERIRNLEQVRSFLPRTFTLGEPRPLSVANDVPSLANTPAPQPAPVRTITPPPVVTPQLTNVPTPSPVPPPARDQVRTLTPPPVVTPPNTTVPTPSLVPPPARDQVRTFSPPPVVTPPNTTVPTPSPVPPPARDQVRTLTPPPAVTPQLTNVPATPPVTRTARGMVIPATPSTDLARTVTPPPAAAPPSVSPAQAQATIPARQAPAPPSVALPPNPQMRTITPSPGPVAPPAVPIPTPAPTQTAPAPNRQPPTPMRPIANAPGTPGGTFDLAIGGQDFHTAPPSPRAGEPTTFTAVVTNLGTSPAQGASVVFKLVAEGRQLANSQPIPVSVAAHGQSQATWSAPFPAAPAQMVITVTANGDANPANNQITIPLATGSATTAPRRGR